MRKVTIHIPVYLPQPLYHWLQTLKLALTSGARRSRLDLTGDREVEWSWIAAEIPSQPGFALDFGSGPSGYLGLVAARRGFQVVSLDLESVVWSHAHPQLQSLHGDILALDLPQERFDLVINCSAIEHVGLAGRYGVTEARPEGDLHAMARLRSLLKHGGTMLMTIPVGRDAVFNPLHRVYGRQRLPRLLEGFEVEKNEYWVKDKHNRWVMVPEEQALKSEPQERLYGLGCFVLRRP